MATAARDRLARALRGDVQTAFSVELTAKTDDLSLAVEGYGPVRLPVTPAKARGLPDGAVLTADLHSLLVYETDQFFLAHQDSEKDDSMVGTLVMTLPSSYTGGELVVSHNGERKAYQGSRRALSLVAFYADCRHEVLPVTADP